MFLLARDSKDSRLVLMTTRYGDESSASSPLTPISLSPQLILTARHRRPVERLRL